MSLLLNLEAGREPHLDLFISNRLYHWYIPSERLKSSIPIVNYSFDAVILYR